MALGGVRSGAGSRRDAQDMYVCSQAHEPQRRRGPWSPHPADQPELRQTPPIEGRGTSNGYGGSRHEPGRPKHSRERQGGWLNVLADFQEPQPTLLLKCRMNQGSGTQTGVSDMRRGV